MESEMLLREYKSTLKKSVVTTESEALNSGNILACRLLSDIWNSTGLFDIHLTLLTWPE